MKINMRYIILYVNDSQKSITFYKDVLGLPMRAQHDTYVEFDTGATILALNTKESVREITGLDIQEHERSSQTFELGFVVEDVQAVIEKLRQQHVQIIVEPVQKPWGQTVAYIADPDGHYIEICSSLD